MKLLDFQKDLKIGDILSCDILSFEKYYEFLGYVNCQWIGFKECSKQSLYSFPHCKKCKGKYELKNIVNNRTTIECGSNAGISRYEKIVFEEFIKEEEFSV